MKEVRRIKFTGKNLNDVFALPCVYMIMKVADRPKLFLLPNMLAVPHLPNEVRPGDSIVEYDNGLWQIVYQTSAISPQTSSARKPPQINHPHE